MKISNPAGSVRSLLLVLACALVAGCSSMLPDKPVRAQAYDLGPLSSVGGSAASDALAVAVSPVQAPAALGSTHVTYRLLYAGSDLQARPYANARWSMPPPQLLEQRLRAALASRHPVLEAGSSLARLQIRLELVEFSQHFGTPGESMGVVRLRTTVVAPDVRTPRLLGQRTFEGRVVAPTPDAPGGVRALRDATDDVIGQLAQWVDQLARDHPARDREAVP